MRTLCLIMLVLACGYAGCATRQFSASGSSRNRTDPATLKSPFIVTCDMENSSSKTHQLTRKAKDYEYVFALQCPARGKVVDNEDATRPLNLMIVIDITNSMGASLSAVKNGVLNLASQLKAQKWDVKIGAIGFADEFRDFIILDFTDAAAFNADIGSWSLVDGQDYQEAGQLALGLALKKLSTYKNLETSRQEGQDAILYIADNVGYAEGSEDHTDFSVDALAKKIKAMKGSSLPNLRIYFSIPTKVKEEEAVPNAPELSAQMSELTLKAGITDSKSFSFPLDDTALAAFEKEYVKVTTYKKGLCRVKEASLTSVPGSPSPSQSVLTDVFLSAKENTAVTFASSKDTATNHYTLTVKRCCKIDDKAKECASEDMADFDLVFQK